MEKKVTVEQALTKGRIKLVYLPMLVIFTIIGGAIFLYTSDLISGWFVLPSFIIGFSLGWLTWSYYVNKWKIWAYENVRNVRELKRKAIDQKLIWDDGNWFEKTEFKNNQQEQKLKLLEVKFLEKDIYEDDLSVPKETIIFYSKTSLTILLFMSFGFICMGFYFLWEKDFFAIVFFVVGIYLAYDQIKKLRNNKPQILINDKGIKLKEERLVSWRNIHNDRVFSQSNGKSSTNYLVFNDVMVDIDELTVRYSELENLLHVYRLRFERKN